MNDLKKKLNSATDTFKEIAFLYLSAIAASSLLYSLFEHKKLFDSLWWAFVTAMTVGYGDTYPITVGGRIVAIALMHVVPLFVIPLFIARFLSQIVEDRNQFTHEEQEQMKQDIADIKLAVNKWK